MVHQIDYSGGEQVSCSSKITIADRIFYVKLFNSRSPRFFSGDQQGIIQKEISATEFDLWINGLADSEEEITKINKELSLGKKY
jgi:hypothetical protein